MQNLMRPVRLFHPAVSRSDTTRLKTEHKIRVPYLNASVDYNVNGMIFGVPFKSEGHFEGSFGMFLKLPNINPYVFFYF